MRQIIIIKNDLTDNNTMRVDYTYWFNAPPGDIIPNGTFVSAAPGTTVAEMNALKSGSVIERVLSAELPLSWSPATVGQYLIERYQPMVNYLNSVGSIKNYTNTYYNGTSWVNVPA